MAESKSTKSDPTIKSASSSPEYPEGSHKVLAPSEGTYSPERFTYRDNPDKPDPSTVAQVVTEKGGG